MRAGKLFILRNVVVPVPAVDEPGPVVEVEAAISAATPTAEGGVIFELPGPPAALYPARVLYLYAPAGVLPDAPASLAEVEAVAVATGSVETTDGAGHYRIEPPAQLPPGDYDVALVCLFPE